MSYTNGFQTLVQSMNGLLTFNDGAGTVIENGNITTKSLTLNEIYATTLSSSVKLWDNLTSGYASLFTSMETGIISIGTALISGGFMFIGSTTTYITLGIFKFEYNNLQLLPGYTSIINLFTEFTTGTCNLFTGLTDGNIDIGTAIESGNINIGSKSNIFINTSATTESTIISNNLSASGLVAIGSSVNRNVLGAVEIVGSQINSQVKSQDLRIGKLLTTGIVDIGSSIISVVVGSFTFLGNSIQAGTATTLNLFTNYNGLNTNILTGFLTGTINFATNMTVGTFNIGKGGNITIGSATTGLILKLDDNGLDNQVIISSQQGTSGKVEIGASGTTKLMGTTTTVGGRTVNVGNQNPLVNSNIVNLGTIGLNTGSNTVNIGLTNTNTIINGGGVTIGANTTGGYFYPSQMRVTSGAENIELYFRGASNTVNNTYETQIKSYNGAPWNAEGQGLQQMFSGQQEFIYNNSFVPRDLPTTNAIGMGYYNGGGFIESSSTISGYAPYGGIRFGGCGSSNTYCSTTWTQSMATYPGYGTRLYNGGISFDKGTLSSGSAIGRGWVPQCGVYPLNTTTISGSGSVQVTMTFGYTYSANPYVTVTMIAGATGGNTDRLIPTVYEITPTQIKVNISNTGGGSTGGNEWGFHYIAWGPY